MCSGHLLRHNFIILEAQTSIFIFLRSSLPCIYLHVSRINQQMHNVSVLYLFSLFPQHVSASICHSQGGPF
jgi:hypothetical protein